MIIYIEEKEGFCPHYLTKGKRYFCRRFACSPGSGTLQDDDGDFTVVRFENCDHLKGGSWTIEEEEDEPRLEVTTVLNWVVGIMLAVPTIIYVAFIWC